MDFAKFRRALKQNKQANKKQNKKCFELKRKQAKIIVMEVDIDKMAVSRQIVK